MKLYYVTNIFDLKFFNNEMTALLKIFEMRFAQKCVLFPQFF